MNRDVGMQRQAIEMMIIDGHDEIESDDDSDGMGFDGDR